MNKPDARKIAEFITNEQILDMFNLAKENVKDWTKVSNCNKGITKVDSLHEDAGSTNVLHLHGELNKSRTLGNPANLYPLKGDLNVGDIDEHGNELRPHVVLFEEMPFNVNESYEALEKADFLIIVGNSLSIGYTIPMLGSVNPNAKVYYVDPNPARDLEYYFIKPEYIKLSAIKGIRKLYKEILKTLD